MPKTKITLRKHVKKRLKQRYNLDLNRAQFSALEKQIGHGSVFIALSSLRESLHIVKVGDIEIPVVYDKQRHTLVTALPQSSLRIWNRIKKERLEATDAK